MTKKKEKELKGGKQFGIGLAMLILSPIIWGVLPLLHEVSCPKSTYGGCTFESGLQAFYVMIFVMGAWVLTGIILAVYGAIQIIRTN